MIYLGVFDNISGDTISVVICTSGNTWKYQGFYAYDDYLTYGSDLEVWEQDPEAYDTGVQHFALTMAETPVTITCNGSNTDIYAPINALSASISILLPTPQLDIYNSDLSTEVMVRNETTDTILFYGYVTPNIYSQDYNDALDYVTLECISPISALEHCKMSASVPRVMNIYEIVKYALEATDYYKEFYVSNTLAINDSTLTRFGVFERLYLYTPNFFDDEGGESWTLKEILNEVCKALNLSIFETGTKLYFLDLFAVSRGHRTIIRYDITNNTSRSSELFLTDLTTSIEMMAGSTDIALDESYSKINVVANTFPVAQFKQDYNQGAQIYTYTPLEWQYILDNWYSNSGTPNVDSDYLHGEIIWTDLGYTWSGLVHLLSPNTVINGFYEMPRVTRHWYAGDINGQVTMDGNSYISKGINVAKEVAKPDHWDTPPYLYRTGEDDLQTIGSTEIIGSYNVRQIVNTQKTYNKNAEWVIVLPCYEVSTKYYATIACVGPDKTSINSVYQAAMPTQIVWTYEYDYLFPNAQTDTYIYVNFDAQYNGKDKENGSAPFPFRALDTALKYDKTETRRQLRFINTQVSIDDWYMVGTSAVTSGIVNGVSWTADVAEGDASANANAFDWAYVGDSKAYNYMWVRLPKDDNFGGLTSYECFIQLNTTQPHTRLYYESAKECEHTTLKLCGNINIEMGLEESNGVAFKVPYTSTLGVSEATKIRFSFFRPNLLDNDQLLNYVLVTNFDMHAETPTRLTILDNSETDTVYTNISDEQFIKTKDDIEIKINTQNDEKDPSLSSVLVKWTDTTFKTLPEIYNIALGDWMKLEEMLIEKYLCHYSTPKLQYNSKVNGLMDVTKTITVPRLGKKLYILGTEYEARQNTTQISAIEV